MPPSNIHILSAPSRPSRRTRYFPLNTAVRLSRKELRPSFISSLFITSAILRYMTFVAACSPSLSALRLEASASCTPSGAAAAIAFDDIVSLVYALKSPYRRNASFLTHETTVAALRKLKDTNGQYLWQPSLVAGQPDRLFGYPIHTSPYVPTVAAGALTLGFGDYANYWIADRQGRAVQRLNELYAGNGQVGFLITQRVDGKVIRAEGIQLLQQKAA